MRNMARDPAKQQNKTDREMAHLETICWQCRYLSHTALSDLQHQIKQQQNKTEREITDLKSSITDGKNNTEKINKSVCYVFVTDSVYTICAHTALTDLQLQYKQLQNKTDRTENIITESKNISPQMKMYKNHAKFVFNHLPEAQLRTPLSPLQTA